MPENPLSSADRPIATLPLLAFAAGSAVANSYYNQAFLAQLAADLTFDATMSALVPMLTQAGNAVGVVFLAPLGDKVERKRLILLTIALLVASLIGAASASGLVTLALASAGIGLFATVAQQMIPLAVHLSPPTGRAIALGRMTAGILVGILLARSIGGAIADNFGWRSVFLFAAVLMATIGILLARRLPRVFPATSLGYGQLLASMASLVRAHASLRRAMAIQFLVFAAFMAFWSHIGLLLSGPPHSFANSMVGLLSLIGVAGVFAATMAGGIAERGSHKALVATAIALVVVGLLVAGNFGTSLLAVAIGVLAIDIGVQTSQVANQSMALAIDPTARSRLNTIFMAAMLLGGSIGSGLGGVAYSVWGWPGVCGTGATLGALALAIAVRR